MRGLYFDSATVYYRAFFAVPESVTAPDGSPSGAIRGFLEMASTIIEQYPAELVVFAWDDDWRPQWRVDLVPSYKTHRLAGLEEENIEETPDTLTPQIDAIARILDAIGVARIGQSGHEADDILGSLVAQYGIPADVVTGDRDLFQLIDDALDVRVLSISKGVKRLEVFDNHMLQEKYGVEGATYPAFSLLRGDASDGLPGVKGIGEKTAAKLLNQFGSIDALLQAAKNGEANLSTSLRSNLIATEDYIDRAIQVVKVRTDAALPSRSEIQVQMSQLKDGKTLNQLATTWGVHRQINRFLKALNLETLG